MNKEEKIIQYYDRCLFDYRLVWNLGAAQAIHYGHWEGGQKNLTEALLRTNHVIAERAGIAKGDKVLDAGCGVGGSAVAIAKAYECQVIGITLCAGQVKRARRYAKKMGVEKQTDFVKANYLSTPFAGNYFNAMYAIESVCQTDQKEKFLKEAHRVLLSGGRLVVADFFRIKEMATAENESIFDKWSEGWGFLQLVTIESFVDMLKSEGFSNVRIIDDSEGIAPSVELLYEKYVRWNFIASIAEFLKIRKTIHRKNRLTALYQYQLFKRGLWKYYTVIAEA